jgi:hypothetical protein
MPVDVRAFIKDHHAFYEVSAYYLVHDQWHGDVRTTRKVQAGFDVDVYGAAPAEVGLALPPAQEYGQAYLVLQRLVGDVATDASDCSLEVIPFPASVVLDSRGHGKVKAMLRIRISHWGAPDQPAGPSELRALEQVKERLDALGISRR